MFNQTLVEQLGRAGVVAVVTVEDPGDGVAVARALLEGGIAAIELTFRTRAAADAIRRIRAEVPEVLIGAGTLLTAADVKVALSAGAAFGVAPGCNPRTIEAAAAEGLPFAPGVMTPTDIEMAVQYRCNVLKFFPCQSAGGLKHLGAMAAPFEHLGLRFIPLGGIGADSVAEYLQHPKVLCVGGSSFASRELIERKDWAEVSRRAADAVARRRI